MPMQPEVGASGPLAREFADYLRSVDGLAELTVDAYAAEARRYLDYLAECPASATAEPAAADGANGVISYLMARQGQGAGSGTLAKAISALRAWYRFLDSEHPARTPSTAGPGRRTTRPRTWRRRARRGAFPAYCRWRR